jgi:hypothetical protein
MKKLIMVFILLVITGCATTSFITPDWEEKWCEPCSSLRDDVTPLCKNNQSKKVCYNNITWTWMDYETFKKDQHISISTPKFIKTIGSYFTWENCKDFLIASLTIFGAGATAYGQSYKQPTYQTYQSTMPRSSSTHCSSNGLGGVDCRTNY